METRFRGRAADPAGQSKAAPSGTALGVDGGRIDVQVNGGWLDSFGYELPVEEVVWTRFLNEI